MPPKGIQPRRTPEQEAARFAAGRAEAEARKQQSAQYYKLHGEREIHSTPGFDERQAAREQYLSGQLTDEQAMSIPGVTVGSSALYDVTSGRVKVPFQSLWPQATIDNPPGGLTPDQLQIWKDYGQSGQDYADFPGWAHYGDTAASSPSAAASLTSLGGVLAAGVGVIVLMSFLK